MATTRLESRTDREARLSACDSSIPGLAARISILYCILKRITSKSPNQVLASGDELVNYEVTTPTTDGQLGVPVAWFAPARLPALGKGDEVVVVGAVRRRFFRAGGATMSRTEVVASTVARSGSRTAERAVQKVHDVLAEVCS